jgi:hypothetical protein
MVEFRSIKTQFFWKPDTHLEVGRDGHVHGLPGRRHPVEEQRVVQRRVPGRLEPEVGPLVTSGVQVLAGEEAEREDTSVEIVVDVRLGGAAATF